MANRRTLKKYISYSLEQLAIDCLLLSKTEETSSSVLTMIFDLQDEMTRRINHTPRKGAKAYYKETFDYYKKSLQEIADTANK